MNISDTQYIGSIGGTYGIYYTDQSGSISFFESQDSINYTALGGSISNIDETKASVTIDGVGSTDQFLIFGVTTQGFEHDLSNRNMNVQTTFYATDGKTFKQIASLTSAFDGQSLFSVGQSLVFEATTYFIGLNNATTYSTNLYIYDGQSTRLVQSIDNSEEGAHFLFEGADGEHYIYSIFKDDGSISVYSFTKTETVQLLIDGHLLQSRIIIRLWEAVILCPAFLTMRVGVSTRRYISPMEPKLAPPSYCS